jgi:AraC-like DNA-binding protein
MDHDPSTPHRIRFNILLYIQEGSGRHFIDFNSHTYESGSFISIGKNQIHAFDFESKPKGKIILFTSKFEQSIRSNIRLPTIVSDYVGISKMPILTVSGNTKQSCEALISQIDILSNGQRHSELISQLLFSSLTLILLSKMPSHFESNISAARMTKFLSFLSLLEENFIKIKDANTYADLLGTTYKTLNQICKLATDQSPKQLIDAHVILEAKRRLAIENVGASELAHGLGFEDVSNFTKYFKSNTLLTPTQFKKSIEG